MEYVGTHSEAWRHFCEAANLAQLHPRISDRRAALERLSKSRGSSIDKLGATASLIANRRNSGMRRGIDSYERQEIDGLIAAGVPIDRIAGLIGVQAQWLEQELRRRAP